MATRSLFLIIVIITLLILASRCYGYEISVGYGWDTPAWQEDSLKCFVLQVEVSRELKPMWYGSVVLNRLRGKVNPPHIIDGRYFSGDYYGTVISGRVGRIWKLTQRVTGRLFGGLGILGEHMPEMGNSKIMGHFGGRISYNIDEWEVGYEVWHMSDPFQHGDSGWEVQLLTIGYRFNV